MKYAIHRHPSQFVCQDKNYLHLLHKMKFSVVNVTKVLFVKSHKLLIVGMLKLSKSAQKISYLIHSSTASLTKASSINMYIKIYRHTKYFEQLWSSHQYLGLLQMFQNAKLWNAIILFQGSNMWSRSSNYCTPH